MAMLEEQSILAAVDLLTERTSSGKQSWESFAETDDEYTSSTPKFIYFVRSRDGDGSAPFAFEIFRVVDERDVNLQVGELVTRASTTAQGMARNDRLERLYIAAKASAWKISGLDDDLLNDLK